MSYSPFTFSDGNGVGDVWEELLSYLRVYVNRRIEPADFRLTSVETEDIIEGEGVGATRADFHAASGDVFSIGVDSTRSNRMYATGTSVTEADYTAAYDFTTAMPGCAKRITAERNAVVVVTVWAMLIAGESSLSSNTPSPEGSFNLSSSNVNSVNNVVPYGNSLFFVEDAALVAPNGGPQPAGSAMNRRPYSFTFLETVTPGSYVYQLVIDLHSEKAFVSARSMTIEVLYL